MKILLIADEEQKRLWDYYQPGMLSDYDLILSCGDLSPHYLQFLVTMGKAELVYVHGNHDGRYDEEPPEGCISAEDDIVTVKGIRILGLGGSMRYRQSPHMYTEKEMRARVRKLRWKLMRHRGFDILLTHAPAKGVNDAQDLPHRGFEAFRSLIEKYHPKYFIHGHMHASYGKFKRIDRIGDTEVINACGMYELEYPDPEPKIIKGE